MSDEAFDDPSLMNAVNNYSPPQTDSEFGDLDSAVDASTTGPQPEVSGADPLAWADVVSQGSYIAGSLLNYNPMTAFSEANPSSTGESNIGTMLKDTWSGTKDILNAPGNSVGAMLLAMALKGIGNLGTQKQNNRALDIQQGHLDLARQKEKSLQASRTGNFTIAAMQPKKAKYDGGMIYSQLTGGKP